MAARALYRTAALMHWPTRDGSDRAAICFGAVSTVGLCCIGCDLASAGMVGAMVAALIDIPFGSITHIKSTSPKALPAPRPWTARGIRQQKAGWSARL